MQVLSVNTSRAEWRELSGQRVLTAIGKQPRTGRVAVGPLGLEGDEQADPTVHGGLSKAVYAYPSEHAALWQTLRAQARVTGWGEPLAAGAFGENLTLQGLTEDRLWVGDRLRLPDCELAVTEPRFPCDKFSAAMGFAQAARMMVQSQTFGAYLAVVVPGTVGAGDAIELRPGPREVGLRELFKARARA